MSHEYDFNQSAAVMARFLKKALTDLGFGQIGKKWLA
jgi:hypothetical protein